MSALVRSIAVLAVAIVALSGCRTVERLIDPAPTPCFGMSQANDMVPLTIDAIRTSMIAVAEVEAEGQGRFKTFDGRPPAVDDGNGSWSGIVTLYPVSDVDSIQGDAEGLSVVAVEGGTIGCSHHEVHPQIELIPGRRYVFILRAGIFPDGAPDLAEPLVTDAWPVTPAGSVATPEDGPMMLDELRRRLAEGGG